MLAAQDAALDRLLREGLRRHAAPLRRPDARAAAPRPRREVAYDFWRQFDLAEELEELRQFRPAAFRALPVRAGRGGREAEPRSIRARIAPMIDQPVGAGGASRRRDRRQRARGARPAARLGHESEIFALTIDDDLRGDVRPLADAEARGGDVTIFHFALPSPMTEAFATLPGARVLQYHNVTPAHFFAPYDPGIFRLAALGRRELATLAGRVDLALGESDVQPPGARGARLRADRRAADRRRHRAAHRRAAACRRSSGFSATASSTSCSSAASSPNKKIEDHIRLAEMYKRYVDSYYRFIFVGRYDGVPRYYAADAGADRASTRCCRTASGSPDRCPTRSWRRTIAGARLRVAERARGLLRAAGRGDGDGRAGAGLRAPAAVPETLGGAGVLLRAEGSRSTPPSCWARSSTTSRCARRVLDGQRRAAARISRRLAIEAAGCKRHARAPGRVMRIAFIVQRYGTEILGGSEYHCRLIAERLAPTAPGRRADHLRAGLHHVEERVSGGHRPDPRRHGAALRQRAARATSTRSTTTPTGSSTTPHTREDEMEWLKQQGPWCPALLEYLERHHQQYDVLIFFTYLYAPTVLGAAGRAAQEPPRADRARRAGDPPRDLRGPLRRAGRHRLEHRRRAAVRDHALLDPRGRGRDRRLRRRPAGGAGVPEDPPADGEPDPDADETMPDDEQPPAGARTSRAGRRVPAAAPDARAVRALRRPHRSGQGLRGAARVLQHATSRTAATRRWC